MFSVQYKNVYLRRIPGAVMTKLNNFSFRQRGYGMYIDENWPWYNGTVMWALAMLSVGTETRQNEVVRTRKFFSHNYPFVWGIILNKKQSESANLRGV